MNVRRIVGNNFTKHSSFALDLPESGVVLVTGPNGSGKSSFVEAVATACFGRTLRGTSPWWDGQAGVVKLESDAVSAERTCTSKGKIGLEWNLPGQEPGAFGTTTKAQEALDHVVGSFDVWRRTSVFSSQDAAHFTLATDTERKRLLESVLGLNKFDEALERCRADLRNASQRVQRVELSEQRAIAEVQTLDAELLERKREANQARLSGDVGVLEQRKKQVTARISYLEEEASFVQARREAKLARVAEMRAELAAASRELSRLDHEACPTCGQAIARELREKAAAAVEEVRAKQQDEVRRANLDIDRCEESVAGLRKDRNACLEERDELSRLISAAVSAEEHAAEAKARWERAKEKRRVAYEKREVLRLEAAQAREEVALLEAVEQVLGFRGVRATVLGRALSGIEAVANAWLQRIAGGGLTLRLRPYSEKKTGGVSDAIGLEVLGAGGGYGYRASSGGERRRIDLALLFALAEVAAGATGRRPGTLFCDEAADTLDEDGVAAFVDAIEAVAAERAVVLITHNQALAGRVRAVKRVEL